MTTIRVTKRHIASGVSGSCHHCPVAHAILDRTDDETVRVYSTLIQFHTGTTDECSLPAPPAVVKFVRDFDAGLTVKPFSFELPLS